MRQVLSLRVSHGKHSPVNDVPINPIDGASFTLLCEHLLKTHTMTHVHSDSCQHAPSGIHIAGILKNLLDELPTMLGFPRDPELEKEAKRWRDSLMESAVWRRGLLRCRTCEVAHHDEEDGERKSSEEEGGRKLLMCGRVRRSSFFPLFFSYTIPKLTFTSLPFFFS